MSLIFIGMVFGVSLVGASQPASAAEASKCGTYSATSWNSTFDTQDKVYKYYQRPASTGDPNNYGLRVQLLKKAGVSNRPIVIMIHGGGWNQPSGSRLNYFCTVAPFGNDLEKNKGEAERLADHGFIVASIDYRLACAPIQGDPRCTRNAAVDNNVETPASSPYAKILDDVYDAVDYVSSDAQASQNGLTRGVDGAITDFGGDVDNIAIFGASAGAHLAQMVGTNPPVARVNSGYVANPIYERALPASVKAIAAWSPIVNLQDYNTRTQSGVTPAIEWLTYCPSDNNTSDCVSRRNLLSPTYRVQRNNALSSSWAYKPFYLGTSTLDPSVPQQPAYQVTENGVVDSFYEAMRVENANSIVRVFSSDENCHGAGCGLEYIQSSSSESMLTNTVYWLKSKLF